MGKVEDREGLPKRPHHGHVCDLLCGWVAGVGLICYTEATFRNRKQENLKLRGMDSMVSGSAKKLSV